MSRLERLTASQEAMLPGIRDTWLACGLSTQPANRALAEEGVREAYRAAKLKPPALMIWLDSPYAGALGQAIVRTMPNTDQVRAQVGAQVGDQVWAQVRDQVGAQVGDQVWAQVRAQVGDQVWAQVRDQVWAQVWAQVRDQVRDQVWDQVRDQVWAQVRAQVWAQVWAQVRDQVWAQVRAQVWAQVWDQVGDQVGAQVGDQVWDQVGDQVGAQVRDQVGAQVRDQVGDQVRDQVRDWYSACIYGQHDAGFLAFYAAMREFGIDAAAALSGLQKVAANAGWWWAFKGAAILTERPVELHRDKDTRLHNASGPAIRYPDGFAMYLWHGTRVPADLIENGWDAERIFAEKNTEVRRCAIERLGWDNFAEHLVPVGGPVADPGNAPYELRLFDLPVALRDMYAERARILLCTNGSPERDGTRHRFGLVVPGHHTSPVDAAADLYGIPSAAYAQLQVRR